MFARVKVIDNLNCAGEVLVGEIPDPLGAIADNDLPFRAAPAPVPSVQVKAFAELFGRLNCAHVGGRIGVADGETFFIAPGLREHASKFDFPCMGRLPRRLAFPPHGFIFHNGYSGPVHFYIKISTCSLY